MEKRSAVRRLGECALAAESPVVVEPTGDAYAAAGVDIAAGNEAVSRYQSLLAHQRDPRVLEGIGGFGGCFAFAGDADSVLVASTDGIGTKVLVAAALGRFDSVGRDLVNHCANDILCANAQPLFFLDYLAVAKLDPAMSAAVVAGVAAGCAESGIALIGGETAEMPGVYVSNAFDLAGTIVGAVKRTDMIDITRVTAGDAIVGLPANGFHTNGYTLVRRILPRERWGDHVDGRSDTLISDALLAVHPSYAACVRAAQAAGVRVKAMAHITGGGILHNLPRVLPDGLAARIRRDALNVPPLMAQVVRAAKLDEQAAYATFNMGIGFCAIVAAADAQRALTAINETLARRPIGGAETERAALIGEIEPSHPCGPRVVIA